MSTTPKKWFVGVRSKVWHPDGRVELLPTLADAALRIGVRPHKIRAMFFDSKERREDPFPHIRVAGICVARISDIRHLSQSLSPSGWAPKAP